MAKFKEHIKESPDRISNTDWYKKPDAFPFGYFKGKFYFHKDCNGKTHYELLEYFLKKGDKSLANHVESEGYLDSTDMKFHGRFWTGSKVISFWDYPNKSDFQKVISELKRAGVSINSSWKVEVYENEKDALIDNNSKLIPINDYGNKSTGFKSNQLDHILSPQLKNAALKNKGATPGYVMKSSKLPKGMTFAQYHHLTKSESLIENANIERLEKLLKNKIITKQKAVETITGYLAGFSLRREFGETMDNYFKRNPKEKKNHDEYLEFKKKLLNEDVPTTVSPSSPETGQYQTKVGEVAKRKIDPESKEKLKKKIKKKLDEQMNHTDKILKTLMKKAESEGLKYTGQMKWKSVKDGKVYTYSESKKSFVECH